MIGISQPGRVAMRIGQAVVDRAQSGGVRITKIGNLHGSRLAAENQQPIAGGVPVQIHENIDPVPPDDVGRIVISNTCEAAPRMGVRGARAEGIWNRNLGVRDNLNAFAVMVLQQRQQKPSNRMIAQSVET